VEQHRQRSRQALECARLNPGVFDDDRAFDGVVEYTKASTDDLLIRLTASRRRCLRSLGTAADPRPHRAVPWHQLDGYVLPDHARHRPAGAMTTAPWVQRNTALQWPGLSCEGPDAEAQAGGIASRLTGLPHALAEPGCEPHRGCVGAPEAVGHETPAWRPRHRWDQWLSRGQAGGVSAGADVTPDDSAASLPPFCRREGGLPPVPQGGRAALLAAARQTGQAVLRLDGVLRCAGGRPQMPSRW
jgi:hypothetical protein